MDARFVIQASVLWGVLGVDLGVGPRGELGGADASWAVSRYVVRQQP